MAMHMCLQGVDNVFDQGRVVCVTDGGVIHQNEVELCRYNLEQAEHGQLIEQFDRFEAEAERVVQAGLVLPAYDYVLKCSHTFNLLDARGAISVTERTKYIARVRRLARECASAYVAQREKLGFPLLRREGAS